MAIEKRKAHPHGHGEQESRTDFEAVLDHVRDNPLLYVATLVFGVVVVVAGFLYYSMSEAAQKEQATVYVEALLVEDDAERAAALAQAATRLQGNLAAEALHMAGESAYRTGDLDLARTYFEQVRTAHSGSPSAAAALEGLGYILEEEGEHEAAMDLYREVQNNHPNAFEARRQWYNLGRAAEKADDLEAAIGFYNDQIDGFPGSTVAQQAQAALDRIRRDHPDIFPEDLVLEAPAAPGFPLESPADPLEDAPEFEVILDDLAPEPGEEPLAEEEAVEAEPVEEEAAEEAPEPVEIEAEAADDEDGEEAGEDDGESDEDPAE